MIPVLVDLLVLCAVGIVVAMLFGRLRLPVVTGLVAAGAIVGPHAAGLVGDAHRIETLAEIGVVLLLFTIGLELSFNRLTRIGRLVAIGGSLQVGLTVLAVLGISLLLDQGLARGLFFGFLFAQSSTAIVLRLLSERQEVDAPHGRVIMGALLFQDLAVVPMMLIIPVLAGAASGDGGALEGALWAVLKAALVVAAIVVGARYLSPRLFAVVDRSRSREAFVLAVFVSCLGTAYLTSLVGLSLALGAFLAGVVIAESDFAHRALGEMLPLRDILTSLFFLSVGMLFDARVLVERPVTVGLLFVGLLLGKAVIATVSALAMRFPLRVAVLVGAGLAQFGEFGFVLAKVGSAVGILGQEEGELIFDAGVLTMLFTPLSGMLAPHVAAGVSRLRRLERALGGRGMDEPEPVHAQIANHVIIVGYGVAGQVLARALDRTDLPHLVLDLNVDAVRQARLRREPVYYGDITSEEAMQHARLREARALVLVINDPRAATRAVSAARAFAPEVPILVRTRYLSTAVELKRLGATDVVSEEAEAGLEMLSRVLAMAGTPRNVIMDRVRETRQETMLSVRRTTMPRRRKGALHDLDDLKVEAYQVRAGAYAVDRTVIELELRSTTGALVFAVRRDGRLLEYPDPADPFRSDDVLYLVGSRPALQHALGLLADGPDEPPGERRHRG